MKVSIIIVTWNALDELKSCLKTIEAQTFRDFETIIVDNGSVDGTTAYIKSQYLHARLICLDSNRGFCEANNYGIQNAEGEYVLTLNSDVELNEDFLKNIFEVINFSDPVYSMFSVKALRKDRRTVDTIGLKLSRAIRFFDIGSGEEDKGQFDYLKSEPFGPCGCAAVYRKSALEKIAHLGEYFDSKFFFLIEDFDIAWRLRKAGFKCKYIPNAVCCHARASSAHTDKYRQYLSFRNRGFLIKKHLGLSYLWKAFPYCLIYDIPRFFYLLATNSYMLKKDKIN